MSTPPPLPIFDSLDHLPLQSQWPYLSSGYHLPDIQQAALFLNSYRGSQGTFNSYRREIERLLHWCALIAKKTLTELKRNDIEDFITFCQKPPLNWIGLTKPPRFINKEGMRLPNPAWRPFVATVSKSAYRAGVTPHPKNFLLSEGALKEVFAILSSFYQYLLQDDYASANPVMMVRQKSKFIRKQQGAPKIRRLSDLQWQYVINTAKTLADRASPYERTLFIMSALYSMYLRISELTTTPRWAPKMNDFSRDSYGNWWFTTVGKGNKQRQIAVSDAMLAALKRWRAYLQLPPFPSLTDNTPLLPKTKGKGGIKSMNYIRSIVQECFDKAITKLQNDGFNEEADNLTQATVHWLRHTGISDDVKRRPREHVRDDAGHSSSAITDKYIDITFQERYESAKKKKIADEEN